MEWNESGRLAAKFVLSAGVVVLVSEIARRSTVVGALLASLPLTSLLAFVWLYHDTGDTARVAALSMSIFWLVLPSLVLFVCFALLLRSGHGFGTSLLLSCLATAASYGAMLVLMRRFGIAV